MKIISLGRKTLRKTVENGKIHHIPGLIINIVKITIFQKQFTHSRQSQSKFPQNSSQKWKKVLTFI